MMSGAQILPASPHPDSYGTLLDEVWCGREAEMCKICHDDGIYWMQE
jgi:hypothetical protein